MQKLLCLLGSILMALCLQSQAASADRNSMVLVTCEPGVPYFSIETLIVDTDGSVGPVVGGNGLLPLRAMIGHPITCMVRTHEVRATLEKFFEPTVKRALEAALITIAVDGEPVAELNATHHIETRVSGGRARVEIDDYQVLRCESGDNERPVDGKERRVSYCTSAPLSRSGPNSNP